MKIQVNRGIVESVSRTGGLRILAGRGGGREGGKGGWKVSFFTIFVYIFLDFFFLFYNKIFFEGFCFFFVVAYSSNYYLSLFFCIVLFVCSHGC